MGKPNACTAKQPNDYLTSVAGLHDQPEVPRACGVGDERKGVADDKDFAQVV